MWKWIQRLKRETDSEPDLSRLAKLDPIYEAVRDALSPVVGYHNMILAGGAVRDTLMGYDPKDYDFFIAGGPIRTDRVSRLMGVGTGQFLFQLRDAINATGPGFTPFHVLRDSSFQSYSVVSEPCRLMVGNIRREDDDLPVDKDVQIICYNYVATPQDIIRGFDIDICGYGYNPELGLVVADGSPSFSDLRKKMEGVIPVSINPTGCMAKVITENRLDRFADRFNCDVKKAKKQLQKVQAPGGHYPYRYGRRVWPVPEHVWRNE